MRCFLRFWRLLWQLLSLLKMRPLSPTYQARLDAFLASIYSTLKKSLNLACHLFLSEEQGHLMQYPDWNNISAASIVY